MTAMTINKDALLAFINNYSGLSDTVVRRIMRVRNLASRKIPESVIKMRNAIKDDACQLVWQLFEDSENGNIVIHNVRNELQTILLSGADNWEHYSFGGCALVYNQDIERHYLKEWDYKVLDGCQLLQMQADCLYEAYKIIRICILKLKGMNL